MDILLVPGLWLDASSWDGVVPRLRAAGHTPHALTMPGVGEHAEASAGVGMADWVGAVVEQIDALDGPVVLVGHSGGGNVAYAALDARPQHVARLVLVDTIAPADGGIVWQFPVVDGVVPFPGWDAFDEEDVADLDPPVRESAAARALSVPARVPTDPVRLGNSARRCVPVTLLAGTALATGIGAALESGASWAAELAALEDLEVVELGTGHWPQYSAPDALADALLAAVGR